MASTSADIHGEVPVTLFDETSPADVPVVNEAKEVIADIEKEIKVITDAKGKKSAAVEGKLNDLLKKLEETKQLLTDATTPIKAVMFDEDVKKPIIGSGIPDWRP